MLSTISQNAVAFDDKQALRSTLLVGCFLCIFLIKFFLTACYKVTSSLRFRLLSVSVFLQLLSQKHSFGDKDVEIHDATASRKASATFNLTDRLNGRVDRI